MEKIIQDIKPIEWVNLFISIVVPFTAAYIALSWEAEFSKKRKIEVLDFLLVNLYELKDLMAKKYTVTAWGEPKDIKEYDELLKKILSKENEFKVIWGPKKISFFMNLRELVEKLDVLNSCGYPEKTRKMQEEIGLEKYIKIAKELGFSERERDIYVNNDCLADIALKKEKFKHISTAGIDRIVQELEIIAERDMLRKLYKSAMLKSQICLDKMRTF